MAQFPSEPVAQKSYDFRTLGLGYANLGTLLMVQGIPYDSPEGRAQCGALTGDHARGRLRHVRRDGRRGRAVPALRGQPRGDAARHPQPSPGRLQRAARDEYEGLTITPVGIDAALLPRLPARGRPRANRDRMLELGEKHGYRNAQVTVIAPTGTIGLVMDCDTTGVEPDFALVKFKKLAGGGYFKIINASVPPALARLGYTPQQIDDIVRYCRGAGTLDGCPHINPASLKAKGFTDEVLDRSRSAAARRLRAAVRLQPLDARRRLPARTRSASRRSSSTRPASTCSTHLGFTTRADRRGQRPTSAAP